MRDWKIDVDFLQQFENGLNPGYPAKSKIPVTVLGYGEISTVLQVHTDRTCHLAFKRMPMFNNAEEVERYLALYRDSIRVLRDRIGLHVVPDQTICMKSKNDSRFIIYIVQKKLAQESIANHLIRKLPAGEVRRLFAAVLREIKKVFDFNKEHQDEVEVGFDGQISNWAVRNWSGDSNTMPDEIELVYFDTSSPLLRKNGVEQLDPELFLRSAPSFMVWIIRLLFLQDVMTRYYDFRQVIIDLIANFYKEQRGELIPVLVETVNDVLADDIRSGRLPPITVKEVKAYYREDAWIWRIYLSARKIDRFLHRLLGKDYPYLLPEKIRR